MRRALVCVLCVFGSSCRPAHDWGGFFEGSPRLDGNCDDGSEILNRRLFVQWSVVDQPMHSGGRLLIFTPVGGTCGTFGTTISSGVDDSILTVNAHPECPASRLADGTEVAETLLKAYLSLSDDGDRMSISSMLFQSRSNRPSQACKYSVSGDLLRKL